MSKFVVLTAENKDSSTTPIRLNIDNIVYYRKFNDEDKSEDNNYAAIFTVNKMVVIHESPEDLDKILNVNQNE